MNPLARVYESLSLDQNYVFSDGFFKIDSF